MNWTAVLPLKQGAERKTRLAPRLSPAERVRLGDAMAAHVVACLHASPAVTRIILLAPSVGTVQAPEWRADRGRGLNAELAALRAELGKPPMLVIHGDLPLVEPDDIAALVAAAGQGVAIASDRHGAGTNALAIGDAGALAFSFGADSCARHQAEAGARGVVVQRSGLALDIDTPDDLDAAIAAGYRQPAQDL